MFLSVILDGFNLFMDVVFKYNVKTVMSDTNNS